MAEPDRDVTRSHRFGAGLVTVLLVAGIAFVTLVPARVGAWVAAVGEAFASPGGLFFIAGLLLALVAGHHLLPVLRSTRSRSHQR